MKLPQQNLSVKMILLIILDKKIFGDKTLILKYNTILKS